MNAYQQFIICYTNCELRYIEALAMMGLITSVKLEKCEKEKFSRIVASLFDGRTITSKCYFDEETKHSQKIITVYIELAKRSNDIGKLKIVEEALEEKD
ncbi:MAG: hypothetical protein QXE24_01555 [Desulfurococcaceae archaeon]